MLQKVLSFYIQTAVQSKLGIKISDQNKENCHTGEGGSERGKKMSRII
jgi:hypothetical protein